MSTQTPESPQKPSKRPIAKTYTEKEITHYLTVLANFNSSVKKAVQYLKDEEGIELSKDTLSTWRYRNRREDYEAIRRRLKERLNADEVERNRKLAKKIYEVEAKAVERVEQELNDMSGKDVSAAAKNLAIERGIALTKAQELAGEATVVIEHRSLKELSRKLERFGVNVPEAIDAEVVEETTDA